MDELDYAIGEVAGEIGAVVGRSVLAQSPRDKDLGEAVGEGELDVGVRLVVAQKNVEARLALLDEIVFEGEGLVLVGDEDIFDVNRLAHERAGFRIGLRGFKQVRTNARAKVVGLAHVDDVAFGVLVEVDAGLGGQRADFFEEIHGEVWRSARPFLE